MEFGVLTLGDWMAGPDGDDRPTQAERFARIVRLAEHAEALGFDAFHVGEHHLCEYIVSSPQMLLAAISQRTERIRLSTGVTLVANRDPVHLAEDYASLTCSPGAAPNSSPAAATRSSTPICSSARSSTTRANASASTSS